MTAYRCLAVAPDGSLYARQIEAVSPERAADALLRDGFTPIRVDTGTPSLAELLARPVHFTRGISIGEQALLMTQLATLLKGGLPVDRALDLVRDQAPRAHIRNALAAILRDIRAGRSVASAFTASHLFPGYVTGALHAAETAGQLAPALATLGARLEATARVRQDLVTALAYPAIVLLSTVVALILVLTLVVPQFEPLFAGEDMALPLLTRGVLALSTLVNDRGAGLVITLGAAATAMVIALRLEPVQHVLDRHRARIPGMAFRDQYISAQFLGLFGTLNENGVPVPRALELVRAAVPGRRWREDIARAGSKIREGQRLSQALAQETLVPATALRLLETGERSGALAATCQQAGDIIGKGVSDRLKRMVALANPIAIILLGAVVALLVGGVMLGIFSLGDLAQ